MPKVVEIKDALLRKYPEQVVLVTTCSSSGSNNIMAVGWISMASDEPPMFVMGIDNETYTYSLIKETGEFTVAYPSESMGNQVLHAGSIHGHNRNKLAECGLATTKALFIKAPLICDAVANFECTLVDIYKPGDCPLIVGKIVAAHENTDPNVKRIYSIGKNHLLGKVAIIP